MSYKNNNVRPFGFTDKIGYMFGDFGNDFTFIFASSFLMIFYTKVLGISGAIVGTLFLIARCIDAFADVTMGRIIDTSKTTKEGRFRPWIRRMTIPVTITSILMYLYFVQDWSYTAKIIYASTTYLIWGICYSGVNIPYGSMASVISIEAGERASLSTFRTIGSTFAILVVGMITPFVIYSNDAAGNQIVVPERFTLMAVIFGVLAIICYTLCYKFCLERVHVETQKSEEKGNLLKMFKQVLSNKALIAIIGAALLLLLATLLTQTMNAYLYMDYFKNAKMLSLVNLILVAATLILSPFVTKLSQTFGKKELGVFGTLLAAVIYFVMYLMKINNIKVFLVFVFIASIGTCLFNLIIWAIITDVIDYQEVKTSKREDGTIYALYSFARKVGQAIAGGIGGFALSAIGYVSDATTQTVGVTKGIYTVSTLVPALCYVGVFVILLFIYPLSKKVVESNTAELKRRRGIV